MSLIAISGTNIDAFFYVRKRHVPGIVLNFIKQELALYSNPQTGCFEHGLPFLENICGIQQSMLRKHLRALRDEGVIEIISRKTEGDKCLANHYRIVGLKEHLSEQGFM